MGETLPFGEATGPPSLLGLTELKTDIQIGW